MAQLVVRNLENSVKNSLQRRAKRNGRSMEEEVRDILRGAAQEENRPSTGLGSAISVLFRDVGLTEQIPSLRGHEIHRPNFEE